MNKWLYIYIWLSGCISLLSSCINEKPGDCDEASGECRVSFQFRYDYNIRYTDLFHEQVDHVSLFIYDMATETLQERIDMYRSDMESVHTISTILPEGEYTAVAWANCDKETDYFAITHPEKLSTLQMGLTCIDEKYESTVNQIGGVFHAMNTFETAGEDAIAVPMSMTKNTNRVRIIVRGLDKVTKEEAEEMMKIRVASDNWLYKHDNSLVTTQFIEYRPEYSSDEEIIADFYILRMQVDYENDIFINLQYREINPAGGTNILLEQSLIPLLLDMPTPIPAGTSPDSEKNLLANELLDRRDEFEIIFEVKFDADGQLYIDNWDRITKPGELGN